MSEIASIASAIFKRAGKSGRFVVAIAGPPGSGKSTLSAKLKELLPEGTAEVVPMDGFHFDDGVLERRGLRERKGSPETFDFSGFEALLRRIRAGDAEIAIPLFDRSMELSRAAAAILEPQTRFVLVEGNYLLLDEEPWSRLADLFDFSVFLDVPDTVLEKRLLGRWHTHGFADEEARAKVASNDLPNARRVSGRRRAADMVVGDGEEL
ncbi:nucleoside triphosphate hydrolase [Aquamicrobium sp.]|uniref:nucleoside triphosphate hydrolase n=1 Tax=Aquamicrobium sp. TaxID=1872579 RepID=UPI00258406EB|nr:nucleoside triphosphate hydrolase [Aquamicrobium sp.]MCK9552857.1 nucleoside triphosphate hydrolase [Aquamicrobium sp.]